MKINEAMSIVMEGAEARRVQWDDAARGCVPDDSEFFEARCAEAEIHAERYRIALDTLARVSDVAGLIEQLDNVSASLQTVLAGYGAYMTDADYRQRHALCLAARRTCDALLRPEGGAAHS